MSSVLSTALSGLNAATTRLEVSAHNIANSDTPRFRRQEVVQTTQLEGGVRVSVQSSPHEGSDLATDLITQLSASYTYKANLRVIATANEMNGSLLDVSA